MNPAAEPIEHALELEEDRARRISPDESSPPSGSLALQSSSLYERRVLAEWHLLQQLALRNCGRLLDLAIEDNTFHVRLAETPALMADGSLRHQHNLRIRFPVHFPAVPLTLHLDRPVFHPNVHPENGFVCLWAQHQVTNTVEHALHKIVAMFAWQLSNPDPMHVMQPAALAQMQRDTDVAHQRLTFAPLRGIQHQPSLSSASAHVYRRRLS